MEVSEVRKRVLHAMERAKQRATERRTRADEATRAFGPFLDTIAVPLVRQVANVLRAAGHLYTVHTPSASVRLVSDRSGEDFIEIVLDTSGESPAVVGHTSRSRGRRVIESESALGAPDRLSEDDVLEFLTKELEHFMER